MKRSIVSSRPLKIAITGGIGSGKSHVCRLLEQHGICVYDCDAAAKRLMRESKDLRRELIQLVGEQLYDGDKLNKPVMAAFMMSSEDNTKAVNAIVHPAVFNDFETSGYLWVESAILFESGMYRYVDKVICVSAPLETRISRVMQRDRISREKTLEWIHKQYDQEEILRMSDYEIVNDGVADLNKQIETLLRQIDNYQL